jgi:hypothetical protein
VLNKIKVFSSMLLIVCLLVPGFPASSYAAVTEETTNISNLLENGDFEETLGTSAVGWSNWYAGYQIQAGDAHSGTYSASCTNLVETAECGMYQFVDLNRTEVQPLKVSGWSKADQVSGTPNEHYSLWVDITYADDSMLYGQAVSFQTGTHGWEYAEFVINPEKPVKKVALYALFRNKSGTVWFDDVKVQELPGSVKAMERLDSSEIGIALDENGSFEQLDGNAIAQWEPFGSGYTIVDTGGRNGSRGVMVENTSREDASGIAQTVQVGGISNGLIVISGWSKAQNVEGDIDQGYALWLDITFADGTAQYGQTASFVTGTHDWQQSSYYFYPRKPVESISVYGLFRGGHIGKVWFDDFSVNYITTEAAAFEDALVQPLAMPEQSTYTTITSSDGLELSLGEHGITSLKLGGDEIADASIPSGFLVADQMDKSDVYAFTRVSNNDANNYSGVVEKLGLAIDADFTAVPGGIKVSGKLTDTREDDRAVTLTFALPIDAEGWEWGDYVRNGREIEVGKAGDVYTYSHLVDFETGPMSIYPMGAIYQKTENKAISLGVDYNKPTHYRIDYNGGTKQLMITFEFGLVPETVNFPSSAEFAFVIHRFDPEWGFRSAFDRYTQLFPEFYNVRVPEQGIWMPFASIRNIPNWEDFGFMFKEGDDDVADTAFANANDILVFHYSEPSTWWQSIDPSQPKTVESAITLRDSAASQGDEMAQMAQAAAMLNAQGDPYLQWLITPWNTGALWMINGNPDLPGEPNGYTNYYSEEKLEERYLTTPAVNGEYLDTLDGYPQTLNYNRAHYPYANTPLVFSKLTGRPAIHRAFSSLELVTRIADRMHSDGNYTMANGTPLTYSIYMPWLDVAGIERDWLGWDGSFNPDNDEMLSRFRTLSGQKPYLLLQNTDSLLFGYNHMEKYMQRSLFYGIFPSNFVASHSDYGFQYWQPQFYERDRDLFKTYIPIIKQVAEAGWMPVTHASSNNADVYLERYGHGDTAYLTVLNDSASAGSAIVTIDPASMGLTNAYTALELISGDAVAVNGNQLVLALEAGETLAIKLKAANSENGGNNGNNGNNGNSGSNESNGSKGSEEPASEPESNGGAESGLEPSDPLEKLVDIEGHWAQSNIERALALGIVNGYGNGVFRPDNKISRVELVAMLARALGWEAEAQDVSGALGFADAEAIPSWARLAVAGAVASGIIRGYEDGTFRPGSLTNRSELAAIAAKSLKLPMAASKEGLAFSDADQIPAWASEYVSAVYEAGVMRGRSASRFAPLGTVTRAEAAVLILNVKDYGRDLGDL